MSVGGAGTPEAGASAPPGPLPSQPWRALAPAKGGRPAPIVTLPVTLGAHAAQTERDMAEARKRTAFDPARIEDVLRDGRIDNETRHNMIKVLDSDDLFYDWKKRM